MHRRSKNDSCLSWKSSRLSGASPRSTTPPRCLLTSVRAYLRTRFQIASQAIQLGLTRAAASNQAGDSNPCTLGISYLADTHPFLVRALILDSSPALGDSRNIAMAFTIAIRNPIVRCIALPIIHAVYALRLFMDSIRGRETMETWYLKALPRPRHLPWMSAQTPRLYVCSKRDELVPWQEVQKHAGAAKKLGLNARCEVYKESARVAHMRYDPERYWASILSLWHIAIAKAK